MNIHAAIREREETIEHAQLEAHIKRETQRLKNDFAEFLAQESVLELRILSADVWSDRWWRLVYQLDIVRWSLVEAAHKFKVNPLGPQIGGMS